ncbi:MAG TPA: radical SAM protein [Dehalococcoidia bacterium]|nr:radical SAM protein [Dehalococcoidia bacterium]
MSEVVLIKTAPERILQGQWYHMPLLSLGYLAAVLERNGVEVTIIDAQFERLTLAQTVDRARETGATIFGITAMTHEVRRAHEVAAAIKEAMPDATIVIGGPHATALPIKTMEDFPAFDYLVIGEGEATIVELISALKQSGELDGVKGLAFRKNGRIVVNEERGWIEDLDSLPFPAWHLYPQAKAYPIFTARGCPFKCAFCMRVLGTKVRYRSTQNIVNEIQWLSENFHPSRFVAQDETFTMNLRRAHNVADSIIEQGLHKQMKWDIQTRVDLADYNIFRRLREAGCDLVGLGIESGNDTILQRIGKGVTVEQAKKAVFAAKKAGLMTSAYYIIGHPNETRDDILKTIAFATKLNTTEVVFGLMVPYPGTEIYQMAINRQGGYKVISGDWSDFDKHLGNALELENLNRRSMELLQVRAYLTFYIKNLRIFDLLRYAFEKRKAILYMVYKILFVRHGRSIVHNEAKLQEG